MAAFVSHFTYFLRFVSLVVACTLVGNDVALAAKPMDAATAKQKVVARGVGKELKVTEAGGTTIRGSIVWIGEESFQLKAKDATQPTDVSFSQVTDVRNPGLSRGAKIGIAVGIVAVAVGILAAVIAHSIDNGLKQIKI